jgi:LPS-assembly protein
VSILFAATLLVLGQVVLPVPGPDELALAADHAHYDVQAERWTGDGHATIVGQQLSVRADHVVYDQKSGRIEATHALMVIGLTAAIADKVTIDLVTQKASVEKGLFVEKRRVFPETLMQATTPEALKAAGQNGLALHVKSLHRVGPGEVEVDGLSFTPCDCDPLKPSWHIDSSHADIRAGDRALLKWPVIWVGKVPVLALPVLYLPLSDRRSGLLVTKPSHSSTSGWAIEQPVFLTLGPSYDLTFTPGYFFGAPGPFGIKGPRLQSELRYAPVEGMKGDFTLGILDDLNAERDPVQPGLTRPGKRGLRGALFGSHQQQLANGFEDRVDLTLASDGYLFHDLTTDLLGRENQYLRSTAVLDQRTDDRYLGVDLVFRQDVRCDPTGHCVGFDLLDTDRADGPKGRQTIAGPRTIQKFPELLAGFPQQRWGPLIGSLELRYNRFAPIAGRFGDEGIDGIYDPANPDPGQGDRIFEPGEREARSRFDATPRLSASFGLGRYATVTPYVAMRGDAYVGELTGSSSARGYVFYGFDLQTELARSFGSLTHALVPSLSFRAAPGVWGDTPTPYDEIDRAIPGGGMTQARVQLSQRLFRSGGTDATELVRLDLGQELDFRQAHKARDSYARAQLHLGPFSANAVVRYDLPGRQLAEVSTTGGVAFGQRLSVWAGYDDLIAGGSARQRQEIDALIGTPYAPGPADRTQQVTTGARVGVGGGLILGYDAILQPQISPALQQRVFSLGYAPACDCWRLDLLMRARALPDKLFGQIDFYGALTISHFGSLGSGP